MYVEQVQDLISQQVLSKLELAYFCIDQNMNVLSVSDNLHGYGFDNLEPGVKADDHVDFIVGLDSSMELDLPIVESPSGIPISVSIVPVDSSCTVLISNASRAAAQRQQLQQAANENELLVDQQQRLLEKLEQASKELETKNAELAEAARLQSTFMSGVSHEFRTPLTSILGYTDLVKLELQNMIVSSGAVSESALNSHQHLSAVQRSSKHLLSLVENLLDHGKLDADELIIHPKVTPLREVIEDVRILMAPLSHSKRIEFEVISNIPDAVSVLVDDSRLRQCLINLIGNAIKFTDEGGVMFAANWDMKTLSISVSDTGPGIAKEDIDKILLPFWQGTDTGKVGTGLGLTITDQIVNLMGGKLEIESKLGEGTRMSFAIPVLPYVKEVVEETLQEEQVIEHCKLLLAEDDADIAELELMLLSECGFDVVHVDNGALAIEALAEQKFDLILMDLHMPVMSGYEAIEALREQGDQTPVLVMSASSSDKDRKRAKELGCIAYLTKPVDVGDIIEIVLKAKHMN